MQAVEANDALAAQASAHRLEQRAKDRWPRACEGDKVVRHYWPSVMTQSSSDSQSGIDDTLLQQRLQCPEARRLQSKGS
jgi:hypothetical protein